MSESTKQATGPRTEAGKAKSSMNALKHGLSITRHVILEHEDEAEFQELCTEVHAIYEPQTARERLAADDIAQCRWALRRFDRAEAFALEFPVRIHSEQQPEVPPQHKLGYMTVLSDQPGKAHSEFAGIHNIMRYRGHWDRRHQRALAEFDRAHRARFAAAREQRAQREDERRQQRHDLHCDLMQAKIAKYSNRESAKSSSPTDTKRRARTTINIPPHIWDKFVSLDGQITMPAPPPEGAEATNPEAAAKRIPPHSTPFSRKERHQPDVALPSVGRVVPAGRPLWAGWKHHTLRNSSGVRHPLRPQAPAAQCPHSRRTDPLHPVNVIRQ